MSTNHANTPAPDETLIDIATGDAPISDDLGAAPEAHESAAAALHAGIAPARKLPEALREKLVREGAAIVSASGSAGGGDPASIPIARATPGSQGRMPGSARVFTIAASILILIGIGVTSLVLLDRRNRELTETRELLAEARQRADANREMLAQAQIDAARRGLDLAGKEALNLRLAEQLASATASEQRLRDDVTRLELTIARYEAPMDPGELQANRTKLMEVPGSVRIEWVPFNLGDDLAEQQGLSGDVVWNDDLQQGFLRFSGLAANDPDIEQYQVWIIDERGMEQKVSGGVFNATADGEVIVPIEPGIDVRRVQLFAVTVEPPGGVWVPDLRRRLVVAPRDDEG